MIFAGVEHDYKSVGQHICRENIGYIRGLKQLGRSVGVKADLYHGPVSGDPFLIFIIFKTRHVLRIAVRVFSGVVLKGDSDELRCLAKIVGHGFLHIAVGLAVQYLEERIRLVFFIMTYRKEPVRSTCAYRVSAFVKYIDRIYIICVTELLQLWRLGDGFEAIAFIICHEFLVSVRVVIIVIKLAVCV